MMEQLNTIARLWWSWSIAMFWQVGLLILLIATLDRLIRRWAWPQLRYALWSLILVKLLLPPSLSLPSGIVPGLAPVARKALARLESQEPAAESRTLFFLNEDVLQTPATDLPVKMSPIVSGGIVEAVRSVPVSAYEETPYSVATNGLYAGETQSPSSAFRSLSSAIAWQVYPMMASLAGTLILGIWLTLRLRSLVGRHSQIAAAASLPQSFYNQLADCAKRLELRCVPRVVVTRRLATPAVFGVFRPVLLMPRGYLSKLSRRDTEHMLLHELAHIKRGDLIAHSLYMLLQVVYWYNPLLWLARRQVHHLRELSCDATVAELLRERTTAYRQTLLDTARRLLTSSVEPGLGLLGLFEDSNRLLVRLNWLTKPTWRYRTMKRVTVATIAALMLACVLPMARAQETASHEQSPTVVREDDRTSQDIASLERRLQELMTQQQQLQEQLRALMQQRGQNVAKDKPKHPEPPVAVQPRVEKTPGHRGATVVPWEDGQPTDEQLGARRDAETKRAHVEQLRAMTEQQRAKMEASRAALEKEKAKVEAEHLKMLTPHMEKWAQSDKMQQWQGDIEKWQNSEEMKRWQQEVEQWGQEMGRRFEHSDSQDSQAAAPRPMPPMPPMPAMPAMPPVHGMSVDVHAAPAAPDHELSDLPNGDRVIDLALPERTRLVDLVDHVFKHTNMNVIYDPSRLTGEIALKLHGQLRGSVKVKDLYQILRSVLEERGLTIVRRDGNVVAIVPTTEAFSVPHGSVAPRPVPQVNVTVPHINVPVPPAAPAVPARPEEPRHIVPCGDFVVKSLPAGAVLRVENNVGSIAVEGTRDSNCSITATAEIKGVDREEAERIAEKILVQVTPADGQVRVQTRLPDDLSEEQRSRISIHFKVAVPREAQVQVTQQVGDVRLSALMGDVKAVADVGSVKTWNLQGSVAIRTNVGNIDFAASTDLSAKVSAQAKIGSISSNLPLEVTGAAVVRAGSADSALGSHATGTLGDGRNKIDLSANVGSIQIRQQSAPPEHEVF